MQALCHAAVRITTLNNEGAAFEGQLGYFAGIVNGQQRPDVARGVVFLMLGDGTGMVNVIVRNKVAERHRHTLLGATLLAVDEAIEREGEVTHLLAGRLTDLSHLLGTLTV